MGHTFVLIQWGAPVKVFDVNAQEFCIFSSEDTVPQNFGHSEISHSGGKFTWVVEKIAADHDADVVGLAFCG